MSEILPNLRITFVLDGQTNKRLRAIHAERIKASERTVPFSTILNEYLKEGLKK